jgi:hypothetical protein
MACWSTGASCACVRVGAPGPTPLAENCAGSGGGVGGQFVTITASCTISPIFSSFGFVPSGTISRSALVETE